jgi:hypothetical protein
MTAATAENWILQKQWEMRGRVSAWELEPPSDGRRRLQPVFKRLGRAAEYTPESGSIDIHFDRLRRRRTRAEMMDLSRYVARRLDDDRVFYSLEDLDDEERGAPNNIRRAVSEELWAGIGDVRQVGPGGRLTVYKTHQRSQIMIRRRVWPLGSAWRPPTEIMETVNDMIGQEPANDARLRGAFGYFEASKLESQRCLRPVFVFVLDRAAAEQGPRWRVASVVAATRLDGLPLTAGLESAAGGCP